MSQFEKKMARAIFACPKKVAVNMAFQFRTKEHRQNLILFPPVRVAKLDQRQKPPDFLRTIIYFKNY